MSRFDPIKEKLMSGIRLEWNLTYTTSPLSAKLHKTNESIYLFTSVYKT